MKTYSIRVDKELAEKISRFARIDDRSDAAVIRKALKEFFFKRDGVPKKVLKKKISISNREALDARKSSDASMSSKYGLTPAQAEEFLKKLPALIRAERQAKEEKIKESKQ